MNNRIWRRIALFVGLFALGFVSAAYYNKEISQCMGLKILTEKEMTQITDYTQQDLSDIILLDGYPAPVDTATNTIYLSQKLTPKTYYTDFGGVISSADEEVQLYFAADTQLENPAQAAKDGHTFKLIAQLADKSCVEYNVVFTTLPVVNMGNSQITGVRKALPTDATGDRDVYTGTVSVWDGSYDGTGSYSAKSSTAQWHQRGNSTFWYEKKSWKLNFKDKDGNNADVDFLGLEADDDWILNGLARDDTRLREKSVMDLWNSTVANEEYNHKMSAGKYVELINDGRYMGIYLLQRRIDAKYLELEDGVEVAKGGKGEVLYETVNTNSEQETLQFLQQLRDGENIKYLDVNNWIDVSLFVDAFYMADNAARYNTFYIIEDMKTQPKISLTLWDTDFSLGINYEGGFVHRPEKAGSIRRNKDELYLLAEIYPDIYQNMSQRWAQLRESWLSEENIISVIDANYAKLNESGAFARDDERWENEYGESDTYDAMCSYIKERMAYLDSCYAKGEVIRETGDEVPNKQ